MVTPAVSSAFLVVDVFRRRIPARPIVLAHVFGLAIVLPYLAVEQYVTGGQMALVRVPASPGRPVPDVLFGGWPHVARTFGIVAKKLVGFIVAGWRAAGSSSGRTGEPGWIELLLIYLAAELGVLVPLLLQQLWVRPIITRSRRSCSPRCSWVDRLARATR